MYCNVTVKLHGDEILPIGLTSDLKFFLPYDIKKLIWNLKIILKIYMSYVQYLVY